MARLKRIEPLSLAKLQAIIMAIFGFIGGVFIAIFGSTSAATQGMPAAGVLLGVGAIIFFPIIYGIMGFISGALAAIIYNAAAKKVGGIEFEIEK